MAFRDRSLGNWRKGERINDHFPRGCARGPESSGRSEDSAATEDSYGYYSKLQCGCTKNHIGERGPHQPAGQSGEVFVFVGDLLDIPKEIARLREECAGVEKDIAISTAKLNNEKFVSRAPKEVVEQERARLQESEAKAKRIRENIVSLEQK